VRVGKLNWAKDFSGAIAFYRQVFGAEVGRTRLCVMAKAGGGDVILGTSNSVDAMSDSIAGSRPPMAAWS
jgi:hypothetical protein